jgi:ssDNA-binding Zn-finger/Zn-ribbon topoisomerase 1
MELSCQQCGGDMVKRTISSGNCSGIIMALIVLAVGVVLIVTIPILGWIIGALLCLLALFMGGKRRKVWQCEDCGYLFDRA